MLTRMLRADFRSSRVTSLLLICLMGLSALLAGTSAGVLGTLLTSMQSLSTAARMPDAVFMLTEPADVEAFAATYDGVSDAHLQEMLTVGTGRLSFNGEPATDDTQESSLVTQNKSFDLLLDLNNERLDVQPGEIAVPLFHRELYDLEVGDTVTAIGKDFTIVSFLRDSTMNPGLASSKRFLINEADYAELRPGSQKEYLASFLFKKGTTASAVERAYRDAGYPQPTVVVTKQLFELMNTLSSGMLALTATAVSLLLLIIATLCLRFSFLTAAENDRPDIATMKAVGISARRINSLYLLKYSVLAGAACVLGYLGSLLVTPRLVESITLYNGHAGGAMIWLLPAFAVLVVFGLLVGFVALLVRGIAKLTALEAFRPPQLTARAFRLRRGPLHLQLGVIDVLARFRTYLLTLGVFIVSAFIIIVPLNVATTIKDESFVNYTGLVSADVHIVLRPSTDVRERFAAAQHTLASDAAVERQVGFVTGTFEMRGAEGWIFQPILTGDHAAFGQHYLQGAAPTGPGDIALSWALAQELGIGLHDSVPVRSSTWEDSLTVTGIYQDITNGGRTARGLAILREHADDEIQHILAVDVTGTPPTWDFGPARAYDADTFIDQSLGETRRQVALAAGVSAVAALALAALMTGLFTALLIARERADIALQARLGIAKRGIYTQYLTRMWILLSVGTIVGTLAANTLGPAIVSAAARGLGVPHIEFVTSWPLAYLATPVALFTVVTLALMPALRSIERVFP